MLSVANANIWPEQALGMLLLGLEHLWRLVMHLLLHKMSIVRVRLFCFYLIF